MASLAQPARALADPVDGVAAAVENERFAFPLVAVVVTGSFAALAYFLRWDSAPSVLGELMATGALRSATETEITEQIVTASRVALITGMAKAIFVTPFLMLALAMTLKVTAWLLGRRAKFSRCFSAVAVAYLPLALAQLILGLCILRQAAVSESQVATIVPSSLAAVWPSLSSGVSRAAASAVDFFRLWSVAVLGLGFSAATGMSRPRGLLVGLALYAMYVGVFMIGLPGMEGGQ